MDMIYKPAFSIIIPTYNRAEKVRACLISLSKQTFSDFEILVCDDGSSDHTKKVVEEFVAEGLNIRYFYNDNWGGPAFPRNIGIKNAKADWVCFLDSDDAWYEQKLDRCRQYIDKYDFICHEADIMTGTQKIGRMKCRSLNKHVYEELLTLGNSIITSSVCLKREIAVAMGGFPEIKELVAVEDFDLWLRIAKAGHSFKVIHEPLGIYNIGAADNISVAGEKDILRLHAVYNRYIPGFIAEKKARGILYYLTAVLENKMGKMQEASAHYKASIRYGRPSVKIKALIRLTLLYIKRK